MAKKYEFENRCPVCSTPDSEPPNNGCPRCRAHERWENLDELMTSLLSRRTLKDAEDAVMTCVVLLDPFHTGLHPTEVQENVDWGALVYALRSAETLAHNLAERYSKNLSDVDRAMLNK